MNRCNHNGRRGEAWGPFAAAFVAGSMASRWGRQGGHRGHRPGGWDGEEGGPGGGGPRGRRGRMFGQGELRLALLKLIADSPRHGYELIKALEELTGGTYAPSPGAVYPTLQLLADEGAIEEKADDASPRKAFAATEQGTAELAERAEDVEALMGRLAGYAQEEQRTRSPHLFRAMGNLASVLRQRMRDDKLDEAAIHEIVDMIDEMARRIERL